MDQLIERCAGLDVHKKTVAACVRTPESGGQRQQHTRTFTTTTKGLIALHEWRGVPVKLRFFGGSGSVSR